MNHLPWLRLYTEIIDDEKLGLLAFEDRWHFIALLCLKGKGVLDRESDQEMLHRKSALKMGLTVAELDKVLSRLARMGLIDKDTLQPLAWGKRQLKSDQDGTAAERQKRFRERNALRNAPSNATVTRLDTDTDTDTEEEKEEKKKPAPAQAIPLPPDLLADFLSLRKAKKAGPLTKTAIAGIQREADKAGISLEDAVTACCEYGWQGFNAGWYSERTATGKQKPAFMTAKKQVETFAERDERQAADRIAAICPSIAAKPVNRNRDVIDIKPRKFGELS